MKVPRTHRLCDRGSSTRAIQKVLLAALVGFAAPRLFAHPVSQGSLEVEILQDAVRLRARVSTEEAFVASAFGGAATSGGETGSDPQASLWAAHGRYLLDHLRVFVGGRRLSGRVAGIIPPLSGVPGTAGAAGRERDRILYDLEYSIPAVPPESGASRAIRLEQDLLNEFEFAPGNRWEATFVVRIREQGSAGVEGLLLTSREPLDFPLGAVRSAALGQVGAVAGPRQAGGGEAGAQTPRLDRGRLFRDYLRHGILHILSGYDHLLFIGALVLATVTFWDLIRIVSAFTLAHTLTLTLAVLGIVRLPGSIVEPMIAASIVFVAAENVIRPERSRKAGRMAVAFFFGLFHGLGFAGGLADAMAGMAAPAVGLAIVAFSTGVEIGHQMIVLPVFGFVRLTGAATRSERGRALVHARAMRYGSALISCAGLVYLFAALR